MRKAVALISVAALAAPCVADAAECSARSGATTAPIVELYTSEGCDSCPPADKWFSTLVPPAANVVPLAFHVDYWDYIGWRDNFAHAAFGQRQRDAVTRQGGRVSYTPQVMLDGRDFRSWSRAGDFRKSVSGIQSRPARAQVELALKADAASLELSSAGFVSGAPERTQSAAFLAITESNLESRVTAGENKGVTLRHDHVVRGLFGPFPIGADGKFSAAQKIALGSGWKARDLSAVVFVQDQKSGETLQALSLPVCSG
jgi:hypothetical protein